MWSMVVWRWLQTSKGFSLSRHRCRLSAPSSLRTSPPRIKSRAREEGWKAGGLEGLAPSPLLGCCSSLCFFLSVLHNAAKSGISATIKPTSPATLRQQSLSAPLPKSVGHRIQFGKRYFINLVMISTNQSARVQDV